MSITQQWINGLLFHTPSQERIKEMKIGELIDYLNFLKFKYSIRFPDDNAINDACCILSQLPKHQEVLDWIISQKETQE